MKKILLLAALAFSLAANAQISKVSLQASGLTCSMCSNAINKALKTLDFVQAVNADIKTYTFEVLFKSNAHVDFDMIREKVERAGFMVTGFVATIQFNNVQITKDQPVSMGNNSLLFVNMNKQSLNGVLYIKILNRRFVSAKEYKKNAFPALSQHSYYATI